MEFFVKVKLGFLTTNKEIIMEPEEPTTAGELQVALVGVWQADVESACLDIWQIEDGEARFSLLEERWKRCVHRLVLITGECWCQKGQPRYCLLNAHPQKLDEIVLGLMGSGVGLSSFCDAVKNHRDALEQELASLAEGELSRA